nr:carbohydrate ABC transporter permease [Clostridia bacterium]
MVNASRRAPARKKRRARTGVGEVIIYALMVLICLTTVLPFMQVLTISLSSSSSIHAYGFHVIPRELYLEGYKRLLNYPLIWSGFGNTLLRLVLGTGLSVFTTVLAAYPLSKRGLPHRNFWTALIVFTMYFNGGLIPSYLVVKGLGLRNTVFALVLPGMIKAYNLIITRNFFMSVSPSLEESARIDGANDVVILFKIILPVSAAIIATITLWYGVSQWNAWFDCMLYMDNERQYVLQLVVRRIL